MYTGDTFPYMWIYDPSRHWLWGWLDVYDYRNVSWYTGERTCTFDMSDIYSNIWIVYDGCSKKNKKNSSCSNAMAVFLAINRLFNVKSSYVEMLRGTVCKIL